jgi:hypothetical protein
MPRRNSPSQLVRVAGAIGAAGAEMDGDDQTLPGIDLAWSLPIAIYVGNRTDNFERQSTFADSHRELDKHVVL